MHDICSGIEHWPSLQPICGHSSQSPVDIKTNYLYPNPSLGLLTLNGYNQALSGGTFMNNGHSGVIHSLSFLWREFRSELQAWTGLGPNFEKNFGQKRDPERKAF